jgi:flagellin
VATVGIAGLNVSGFSSAQTALVQIDNALTQINTSRADMGAVQSRFETVIANIQVMNENITAARGRIMDADFAAETANMSRANILQQAGTAMVAQANQLPQQVLQLLK